MKSNWKNSYIMFTVEELRKMPSGTVFDHITLGKCMIKKHPLGITYMVFSKLKTNVYFNKNDFPWDLPLKILFRANDRKPSYWMSAHKVENDTVRPIDVSRSLSKGLGDDSVA